MFEPEIVLIFDHGLASIVINERKDGKNNGKLRDSYAGTTKSVDDGPGMTKPGDFRENQSANQ